jgi:hypothetical protein
MGAFWLYGSITVLILMICCFYRYKKSKGEAGMDERVSQSKEFGLGGGLLPCKLLQMKNRFSYMSNTVLLIILSFGSRLFYLSEGI